VPPRRDDPQVITDRGLHAFRPDDRCGHPLATALPDVAQRFKRTRKSATCLFEELSPRSDGRVLALIHCAF
jgi:hypothetical protein